MHFQSDARELEEEEYLCESRTAAIEQQFNVKLERESVVEVVVTFNFEQPPPVEAVAAITSSEDSISSGSTLYKRQQ